MPCPRVTTSRPLPSTDMLKRLVDIIASGLLLVVLALPMSIVAIVVRVTLGSPVLFRSFRPGLNDRIFTMYKFRTMSDERDDSGVLVPDKDRLSGFGRFLRSTSVDELPELFNVLKGDMSLVGPRPLLPEYLDRYSERHARRHEVRPGITGLAQVRGRNDMTWEERLELDVWYVDNHTMPLDLSILLLTIVKVIKREGISARDHATMPEFEGTEES